MLRGNKNKNRKHGVLVFWNLLEGIQCITIYILLDIHVHLPNRVSSWRKSDTSATFFSAGPEQLNDFYSVPRQP